MQEFEYSGKAMGVDYHVAVVCSSRQVADAAYAMAKSAIEACDARFSRFVPHSELSLLNEAHDMEVSAEFLNATLKARRLFEETRGVFNPLVQIARFGYDRDFAQLQDGGVHDDTPYDIDFSSTTIDQAASRVRLRPGQRLDYGGFLKGYLAELLAKEIEAHFCDVRGVVVNLGGDIHARGADEEGREFVFYIHNPGPGTEDIPVTLHNQSLATSGTYKRHWMHAGKPTHHILGASGVPSEGSGVVSASVVCEDGGRAEAYAKVFLLLGPERATQLLGTEGFSFVTITKEGEVTQNIV